MWSHTSSVFVLSTSNWVHATHTYKILKLENMNGDGCYMQLYFSDKLSSLGLLDMSAPSVRHVWDNRFSSIRHDPEYAFTPLIIFLPPPPSRWRPRWLHNDLLPPPTNLQGPWGGLFPSSDRPTSHRICSSSSLSWWFHSI
jgi:hypothetical protein